MTNSEPAGRIDLHMHSTASDGELTPAELVKRCARQKILTIALTDHDTVDGVLPAQEAGTAAGVQVIAGTELGTRYRNVELHLLGYFIDIQHASLRRYLARLTQVRIDRARQMVEKLDEHGMQLAFSEVEAQAKGDTIGRPHIAKAMLQSGLVRHYQEAFDFWIGDGKPACVEKSDEVPRVLIDVIRSAGGVAVLAHPGSNFDPDLLDDLVAAGLQGIEAIHPRHTRVAQERIRQLGKSRGLLITGGSDFHGGRRGDQSLGKYTLPTEDFLRLQTYHQEQVNS